MGEVNLARIDERLIHGQVMLTLSQRAGVNSIFVVDDVVAQDKFMVDLYRSAGARTGQHTVVMPVERAKYYWDKYEFRDYSTIIICKTVDVIYDLVTHGVPMKELNVGGIAMKDPSRDKQVSPTVYLNKEDAIKLKELHDDYGVENIYFQATPSAPSTSLEDVLAQFDL